MPPDIPYMTHQKGDVVHLSERLGLYSPRNVRRLVEQAFRRGYLNGYMDAMNSEQSLSQMAFEVDEVIPGWIREVDEEGTHEERP